jgi:hypothetical protein
VAVFAKLPFVVPAVLVVAAAPGRAVAARWAVLTVAVQAVAFTAVFGFDLWRSIIQAQAQAGGGLELQVGPWVQAGWNEFPLLLAAAAALWLRGHARDHALLLTTAAAAAGALLSTITMIKPGTGLNVIVPSEPLLATLAVTGVVLALRADIGARVVVAGTAVLGSLLLAQSISLLADPTNPRPFHRPLSSSPGWKVLSTRDEVDRMVRSAERCPPDTVYPGPPLVAFLAHRRVPGGQPDYFIVSRADIHARVFARVRADGPRCQ